MTQATFNATDYDGTGPENYEKFFVPAIGGPLAKDLVASASLQPGERVLDVACGTGVVTRLAARQVGQRGSVAGLDVNPGMLSVARSVTPGKMAIDCCRLLLENPRARQSRQAQVRTEVQPHLPRRSPR